MDDFDGTAAAPSEAASERLPDDLREKILADARTRLPGPGGPGSGNLRPEAPRRPATTYLAWVAAAAMIALMLWAPSTKNSSLTPPGPSLATDRQSLIDRGEDVIVVDWAGPEVPGYESVRGDVVWSHELQAGFLRLVDLPANRPDREQYQLWIVDPSRDRNPIDGGVFDIAAGPGETIVPIDPKLHVGQATVFAITLEQPGGVVVSDGPLLVVAPIG